MTTTGVRTERVAGPSAWTAADLGDRTAWSTRVTEPCLREFDQTLSRLRRDGRTLQTVTPADFDGEHVRALAASIRQFVDDGPGFVVVEGVPTAGLTTDEASALYWGIGTALGEPLPQNRDGDRVYLVRDEAYRSATAQVRGSKTNAELIFHTDSASSFAGSRPDVLGLLCIRTARAGGTSSVLSGHTVYNALLDAGTDVSPLYDEFCWDRSAEAAPGEDPVFRGPICWVRPDGRLCIRYNRAWLRRGHRAAGVEVTGAQRTAIDAFDAAMSADGLAVPFDLRPGEVVFANNDFVLHNRTAFEDHDEPERKRLLVRLWIRNA